MKVLGIVLIIISLGGLTWLLGTEIYGLVKAIKQRKKDKEKKDEEIK